MTEHDESPIINDRRRIDPETGEVRPGAAADAAAPEAAPEGVADDSAVAVEDAELTEGLEAAAADLAAERLEDLQRLQAEFVNYKRRVERDRDVAKSLGTTVVLESVLPVLDDIYAARNAGDLESGPFAAIAEKLESTLQRFGLERYGTVGEEFDPSVHEALLHTQDELAEGTTVTTVVQILQPGYRAGEKILRPARVAVADPS